MSTPAPIALFAYRRPDHLGATLASLMRCEGFGESQVVCFFDGPRNDKEKEVVNATRETAKSMLGGQAEYHFNDANQGLSRSVIAGVTEMVSRFGRVIVLEDDLVTSPHFLRFMNEGLNRYEDDERVISIHGYQYPVTTSLPETFFLRGADCWGWATWKRGWDLFEPNGRLLLRQLREHNLTYQFDLDGAYPYTRMLKRQIEGKNDSWAIRWHASAFLNDKLTLYPGRSLVRNIGMDSSGTHCATTDTYAGKIADSPIAVNTIPTEEHAHAREQIVAFHKASRPPVAVRMLWRLVRLARMAFSRR